MEVTASFVSKEQICQPDFTLVVQSQIFNGSLNEQEEAKMMTNNFK